ncbi:uncharacterized protein LOC131689268 isoform X2 [Topomyia yanbarensis]|uniref:uncharacterized protein LOC131689268 isoform X2 n=1 Tax=Topomyia yanbarensis TaxID=2498891 RepID=UPI00273CB161|nr:uncharacterized protein LOC131689268 isoform X2 [Topomyia yanbarensis]
MTIRFLKTFWFLACHRVQLVPTICCLFGRRIISPPSPRLHKKIHAAQPSPGRLLYRTTEAPERSDAVVLPASDQLSRPGPAFGGREGVFRTPFPGDMPSGTSRPFSMSARLPRGTDDLRLYYQNVRGLRTKIEDLYLAALDGDYDIYVLTETWLDDRITSMQLFGDSYAVYRADRSAHNSVHGRGGGVLVAVSFALASCDFGVDSSSSIEVVWTKITTQTKSYFIGAVYIPPEKRLDCTITQLHLDSIEHASSQADANDVIIVLGDFNQPGLMWVSSGRGYAYPNPLSSTTNPASRLLLDGMAFHGLNQVSTISNHQSRFLDLVFVNENALPECSVSEASSVIVPLDNYHPALEISISIISSPQYEEALAVNRRNFRKTDLAALRRTLSLIDWSVLLDQVDVNAAVDLYNRLLIDCVEKSVPEYQPPKKPPWSNAMLRNLKRTRAKALRAYTNRRCPILKRFFALASNEYRCYNKLLYKGYVNRIQQNLRRNPKGFWAFVKTKRKETGLPSRMVYNGEVETTTAEKCSLFASYFSSVFTTDVPSAVELENATRDVPIGAVDMDVFTISVQSVLSAIRKTKSSYAPGYAVCCSEKMFRYLSDPTDAPFQYVASAAKISR